MNQKSPKDPKSIFILTMKLLQTYFWKRLPIGDLISLTPISLAFSKSSQIGPSSSNHLKSTGIFCKTDLLRDLQFCEQNRLHCEQVLANELLSVQDVAWDLSSGLCQESNGTDLLWKQLRARVCKASKLAAQGSSTDSVPSLYVAICLTGRPARCNVK